MLGLLVHLLRQLLSCVLRLVIGGIERDGVRAGGWIGAGGHGDICPGHVMGGIERDGVRAGGWIGAGGHGDICPGHVMGGIERDGVRAGGWIGAGAWNWCQRGVEYAVAVAVAVGRSGRGCYRRST